MKWKFVLMRRDSKGGAQVSASIHSDHLSKWTDAEVTAGLKCCFCTFNLTKTEHIARKII